MTPLEKLQRRWLRKTGESMPLAIERLPIGRVLFAVKRTEAGETVFVPGCPVARVNDESLREWDCDGEF